MKNIDILKKSMVIAALVLTGMAAPQARASGVITYLFTSPSGLLGTSATFNTGTTQALIATGYNCGSLCASSPNASYSGNLTPLFDNTATSGSPATGAPASSDGLGIANNTISGAQNGTGYSRQEIPNTEFIQLNFTTILANYTVTSIVFQMTDIVTSWSLYTSSTAGKLQGGGTQLVADSKIVGGNGSIVTAYTLSPTSSSDDLISVVAGTNCDVVLNSVTVNYSGITTQGTVPEPAMLLLTGLALLGLGGIIKKTRKNA